MKKKSKKLKNYFKKINFSAPEPEDGQVEIYANSATAKTEFTWGFIFWSFMNFGAPNALSGVIN